MKLIVQDEDLLDKEDTAILDRMAQFASRDDVFKIAAAKQLLAAIKRAVSCFSLLHRISTECIQNSTEGPLKE